MSDYRIDTKCIQAGYQPGDGEPRVLPIVQSTTFKYDSAQKMGDLFDLKAAGHFYTRLSNPTSDAVERKIAALEGGVGAMLTSSGDVYKRQEPQRQGHQKAQSQTDGQG